jgi:hypothetical protein
MRTIDVNLEFLYQFFQRVHRKLMKDLYVGGFERFLSSVSVKARGKPVVMVGSRVVVSRRSKIDQAAQVAGNLAKRTPQKIVVGLLHGDEFDCGAHAWLDALSLGYPRP